MSIASRYELPAAIASWAGEINDLDSHECVPVGTWLDEFGSDYRAMRDAALHFEAEVRGEAQSGKVPPPPVDDVPITSDNVWRLKMESAPGTVDLKQRRLDVMDFMGVKNQILYPGAAGAFLQTLLARADDPSILRSIGGDRAAYALRLIDLYNDWCSRLARQNDRLRPTALLVGETPDDIYERAKKIINSGVRLLNILPDAPPAGVSPADPALDRLWALIADAGCALVAHVGPTEGLLKTMVWREAPGSRGGCSAPNSPSIPGPSRPCIWRSRHS